MKNKKILTVCALVLLGGIALPSSGHAGGGQNLVRQLTGEFPKICRIFGRNPVAVMAGRHRKPLNCTGTMLSNKHVLTTVGSLPWHVYHMDEVPGEIPRIYAKPPKVYTPEGEHNIAEVYVLPKESQDGMSHMLPKTYRNKGAERKVHEDLAIIKLENSVPGVLPPQISEFGSWHEDVCEGLVLVSTKSRGGHPIFLRIPFALFSQYTAENFSREHCMLLGTALNYDTDPDACASATVPVNVGSFSQEYLMMLHSLWQKNYGRHMCWELQAHDEGAPICGPEGQLVGLAATDPCYTDLGDEIEGAFPIITLCDPETGEIRENVLELFDTAGLAITHDCFPLIKE